MTGLENLDQVVDLVDDAAAGGRPEPLTVSLRDGSTALLRPITPEDAWRLREGIQRLSPRSRYRRFLTPVDHLTDEQLDYLTEVDHRDHAAWVALDADEPDEPGMGVARYVRLDDDPEVAEAAVTVLDRFHGRGLGTILLGVLARTALHRGVRAFRNYVLADNDELVELARQLGAEVRAVETDVWVIDAPLPAHVEDLPDTPAGRALRRIGAEEVGDHHLRDTVPPVWTEAREGESPLLRRWLDSELGEPDGDGAGAESE